MATKTLPSVAAAGGLSRYLEEIRKFPMLEPQQEYMLAKRWREHEDRDAAHQLVTSHLRLVARIAMGYRGYGLPIGEVMEIVETRPEAFKYNCNLAIIDFLVRHGFIAPEHPDYIAIANGLRQPQP